jgi:hypothetical protein
MSIQRISPTSAAASVTRAQAHTSSQPERTAGPWSTRTEGAGAQGAAGSASTAASASVGSTGPRALPGTLDEMQATLLRMPHQNADTSRRYMGDLRKAIEQSSGSEAKASDELVKLCAASVHDGLTTTDGLRSLLQGTDLRKQVVTEVCRDVGNQQRGVRPMATGTRFD